jgi:hypothetical protein
MRTVSSTVNDNCVMSTAWAETGQEVRWQVLSPVYPVSKTGPHG